MRTVANRPSVVAAFPILLGLLFAVPAGAQDRLDIESAIRFAVERNRDLVRAALGVQKGGLGVQAAKSDFGVSVVPDGAVGSSTGEGEWQYGLLAQKKFTAGTEFAVRGNVRKTAVADAPDFQRGLIRVELNQPLFRNFGRLIHGEGVASANDSLRTEQRSWEQQKADLVVQVVTLFETILQFEARITSDEALFQRMEKLYALTKAREKQGRTTRVDSLRVELQRGEALARLENNRERLFSARREFAELIGFDLEREFDLEPPPLLEVALPSPEEAVGLALGNRLDYAQALQDRSASLRATRIARRGLYPDLNLTARHDSIGQGTDSSEATDFNDEDWFVGVTANTDLNQTRARTTLQQARLDAESADQAVEIRRLSIAREVQQALSQYRRTHGELKIAERNYELAGKRAELARSLFRLGKTDNFSVTDAENALVQAEGGLLESRAAASISGYELLRSMGTLVEYPEPLKPPAAESRL